MSDPVNIAAGTVVGGCKILECIGSGGMGQVYKAQHQRLGRMIALKILPEDVIRRNPAGIERFFQEARALANIDHPNVLTIHDCGQEGEYHYLQTRYIDGRNLEELVDDGDGGLPWEDVREILIGALEGLGAVHAGGMVHRDVKPANFMLDGGKKVVLMDFGLAKFLAADNEARTEPGYVLGTPQYMSPEQCNGFDLDPRSDLYSLGCVAYFLLTGKRPFDGDNPLMIMKMHRDSFAEPLAARRPDLPASMVRTIERMMNKDPDERFGDAQSCIAALREVGNEPAAKAAAYAAEATLNLPPSPPTGEMPVGLAATAGPLPTFPNAPQRFGGEVATGLAPVQNPPSLEVQSLETVYRTVLQPQSGTRVVTPPPGVESFDPIGPTLSGPGIGVRRPISPSVPPPPGIPVPARATPAAPLPPAAQPPPPADLPTAAEPTAPPVAAPAAGPSTMQLQANVQRLRRSTGRLEPAAGAGVAAPAAPASPAPASALAETRGRSDVATEIDHQSRVLQAVQCKQCRHIWRIERARVGKVVRCPNCNKDTPANIPENLLKPRDHRRLMLKIVIVVVLLGAFGGAVTYFYNMFGPKDASGMTVNERVDDVTKLFKDRDFPQLYDRRFTARLKSVVTRLEWEQSWALKMMDRQVNTCTLEIGTQAHSPITGVLIMHVQRVTGARENQTYKLSLVLVEEDREWKIDSYTFE